MTTRLTPDMTADSTGQPRGPLSGIRVLDVSTVYAAPITAMLLGDHGAEVIEVEHPRGDPARTHGWNREGHGLWWKVIARNKRTVTRRHAASGTDSVAEGGLRDPAPREGHLGSAPVRPPCHQLSNARMGARLGRCSHGVSC